MYEVVLVGAVAAFAICVVFILALWPRRTPGPYHQRLRIEPRADFSRREGLAPGETHPRWRDHETYPAHTLIRLSARDLESINIARRLAGRLPLTRGGFTHGVAVAGDRAQSQSELLTWLLVFESIQPSHYTHRCAVDSGITVQPTEPFNGLGGSYAGAGASGSWDAPAAASHPLDGISIEECFARGENPVAAAPDPTPTPTPAATPDSTPSYSAPDTSYSAPSVDTSSVSASVDVGS